MRIDDSIDHVVFTFQNEVKCQACGQAYEWNMPVPVDVVVAGCQAFARRHRQCPEWRQGWRRRLLDTLLAKHEPKL